MRDFSIKQVFSGIITIAISSSLYYLSTGFNDAWFLTWIVPLPVLLFALKNRWLSTAIVAYLSALIGAFSWVGYIHEHMPFMIILLWLLVAGIILTIEISVTRWLIKRTSPYLAVFVFPSVVVIVEYLQMLFSSAGTYDSISYTQITFLPILQIASATGFLGVTFLISLPASAIAVSWYYRRNFAIVLYSLIISGIIMGLALIFGYVRIDSIKNSNVEKIKVALIDGW